MKKILERIAAQSVTDSGSHTWDIVSPRDVVLVVIASRSSPRTLFRRVDLERAQFGHLGHTGAAFLVTNQRKILRTQARSLPEALNMLSAEFYPFHRGAAVNINYVRKLEIYPYAFQLKVQVGEQEKSLSVSRAKSRSFCRAFGLRYAERTTAPVLSLVDSVSA